ncbi:hypothetical protein [uncultured Mailhella sp.]|uniref:hypothetical protein n=1 Tax=uncultured Mailhella sp. TaxID=1981031 RepID=UPI0025DCCC28|nr:hypothetical protein [uncultured Mailhella sp.]
MAAFSLHGIVDGEVQLDTILSINCPILSSREEMQRGKKEKRRPEAAFSAQEAAFCPPLKDGRDGG